MIERTYKRNARVAIFCVGHAVYWGQFVGLLDGLLAYHGEMIEKIREKEGPITMLGITTDADGRCKFVIGEGESKKGSIPPTGNTNTRGYFAPDTKTFIKKWVAEGPTHHFALGIGHRAETLKKIADILGIEAVIVR